MPAGLRLLDHAEREGLLDQDRSLAHVAPSEGQGFAGSEARVGENGDQGGVHDLAGHLGRDETCCIGCHRVGLGVLSVLRPGDQPQCKGWPDP